MAQRYSSFVARERMNQGRCPECGRRSDAHSDDKRFWVRVGKCDLTSEGVDDRILQFLADEKAGA